MVIKKPETPCSANNFSIQVVDWQNYQETLRSIRTRVFIEEQNVPVELEWDGLDEQAVHILALMTESQQTTATGCARILFSGQQAHIGRMAVLSHCRGQGIGSQMLQACIAHCRHNHMEKIILNAQVYVLSFYLKAGFSISSDEFSDAGIAHREMTLNLDPIL